MAPPPPPSFSSFPSPSPKPPPPSFSSFPPPRRSPSPHSDDRPSKRPRATEFLQELESEIYGPVASGSGEGRGKGRERGGGSRDEEGEGGRISKSGAKSSKKRERRSKDVEYEEGSLDPMGKGREHETKLGDYGKTTKAWKLVKVPLEERTPAREAAPPPDPSTSEVRIFYSDKRGDEFNIRYGGLNKGDIPRYRRLGAGRVVGFNSGLRITLESAYTGRGLEVGPNTQYRTPRYMDPRSIHHATDKHIKRISLASRPSPPVLGLATPVTLFPPPPPDPFLASSSDPSRFVPFEAEQSIPDKLAQLEFEEGTDYRSIAGLVKPSDLEDPDEAVEDDIFGGAGISGGESRDDYLKRRNLELDRGIRATPNDVDLWLEFVDFQDEVAVLSFMGGSTNRAFSKGERTSTSEIKMSILDRALAVDGNKGSEPLLLAYLRAASDVWDPQKVLHRWGETLRSHPSLTGLWIEYVSWRQTTWTHFGVRDVVEVFEECFKVLGASAEKEAIGSQGRDILEGNAIYLFLRCCLMLRQAGYSERALAAFQAIIELNFCRPDTLTRPAPREPEKVWLGKVVDALDTFWESDAPRVGEAGAKGWKHTGVNADPLDSPAASLPIAQLNNDLNPFERWVSAEQLTATTQPRPARVTDPGVDDDIDPFRVVLFDDVRDFIFVVHSPDSLTQLVYAFLTFLGLPFVPPDYPTSTSFTTDPFIHTEAAEREGLRERFWPKTEETTAPFDTIGGEPMEHERRSALKEPFYVPFHASPASVELLFAARQKWFVALGKDDLKHVDVEFARNTFTLLRPVVPVDGFFTLNFFAFEASQSPKVAIKLAKSVLNANRQNLSLWDGYARIERQRGKIVEARAVYVTALSMYREFAPSDQIDGPLLWRSWAEMEWEEGKGTLALKVLVASTATEQVDLASLATVDPTTRPSPSQILRTRQSLATLLESSFLQLASTSTLRSRPHLAYSSALFEYLSDDLSSATEVFERHLFRLDCAGVLGSAEHEEAYMMYVKLLWRHAGEGKGYKPGQLREVLERAIPEFPHNSLFLSLFYSNEVRMKVQNRVRRTLELHVLAPKVVTSPGYLFAIFAEAHLDARSRNVWGVRNLFDRAVENPKTSGSASVWMLYIDFELRNNELGRAKSLVYRAVRACPWCKELYLKPFSSPLRTQYRTNELKEMHSLLLEKGLRVRVELDDFLAGWQDPSERRELDDGEDEGVDIAGVEEFFEERKRLMPY